MRGSKLEQALAFQIRVVGLPKPEREFRFHPTRKWRFDFAWPDQRVAVEIEGGIWIGGAHVRGKHFESDCMKYNCANLLDWVVLRYTASMIKDGTAISQIEEALK